MVNMELEQKVTQVGAILIDQSKPLKQRFRALFTLRSIGGEKSIECIQKAFNDPSALLKHELAYCLGQMRDKRALPGLIDVLKDKNQEPMVRHEAGEAIGAIGCDSAVPVLTEYANDDVLEVAQTCQLALKRIQWLRNKESATDQSIYSSVDPAPAALATDIEKLTSSLLNDNEDIFERYKAMFALRNLNTPESITALTKGLFVGTPLFRHEVAFVLGQIQSSLVVGELIKALEDTSENEMVRHECAEALGAIATDECIKALEKYQEDESRVVRESCAIALDMADYEKSNDFQYANTVSMVSTTTSHNSH